MDIFYPLKYLSSQLSFGVLGLDPYSHLGESIGFFIYESAKILILLLVVGYLMAVIRHYLPIERLRDVLASRRWYGLDYLLASLFGTLTPFCSCSSIPLFVGFLSAGIPLGVTFSFLITSPLVNQVTVVLFVGLFGWKVAVLYAVSAVLLGMVGGFILSRFGLEKYVVDYVWKIGGNKASIERAGDRRGKSLLVFFWQEGWALTKKIALYVFLGIGVGAVIHGYVPAGFFEKYISVENLFAVPLSVVVAVPMYANAVGVIPILQSLVEKGVPLGTALAFMMAVVGLSLPEALILRRVMKVRLLLYFFGITAVNIIVLGYIFNIIF